MKKILIVLAVVFIACFMGVMVGCSSKQDFDGTYTGTEKSTDEYEEGFIKFDLIVEDGYMNAVITKGDEYDEKEEDYDVVKLGTDYKYNKNGNAIYFKSGEGIVELREVQGKYHGIIKDKNNEIKTDIILKKK